MEDNGNDGLPQFPVSREGLTRMKHLPTIEACIRYWDIVRVHAIRACDPALEWTARALLSSYEQARQEQKKSEPSQKGTAAPRARRTGRPPASGHLD
jgi:hypothetical protein